MLLPATDLPDPLVLALPVIADPVDELAQMGPQVVGDRGPVLVEQVDRVHELAVDVELELVVGAVTDPDRARAVVTIQVIQGLLGQVAAAVYAVHQLQGAVGLRVPAAGFQPAHERLGLLGKPDAQEPVEGEGGVPDPGVAVVPVTLPADTLGQAARRRRYDRTRRLVGQELERQGRAVDHLAPAARVGAFREPAAPVLDGLEEELLFLRAGDGEAASGPRPYLPEHEHGHLVFPQGEVGDGAVAVAPQGYVGSQSQAELRGVEAGARGGDLDLVGVAGVVESRGTLRPECHAATNHLDAPDQLTLTAARGRPCRHVVRDLADAVRGEEPGEEDVGVGPIELLVADPIGGRGDAEPTTLLIVEDGREDARGIEARETEPVYRAVHPDQGRCPQVPDDTVVLYRLVRHGVSLVIVTARFSRFLVAIPPYTPRTDDPGGTISDPQAGQTIEFGLDAAREVTFIFSSFAVPSQVKSA